VEVSALRYPGSLGLHGRTPLLRLQSDERLIAFIRRGNNTAFEVLFSRYQSRLLAFCRHLLGSKEDAEDVLQEVMAAAFNAILADERAINVRPWLYRIARNRSLNHLRRAQAIGMDSMDIHLFENGASTADKVHEREQFRQLVDDIQDLPETQRTALVLREMDAMSYDQIAEAMETTVPGVKSLLVRARIALAEAAEARQLSCADVRIELGEVAEGIRKKPDALARRHLRSCTRCSTFQGQLKKTNRALAAVLPIGPLALLKKLAIFHIGHTAGTGSGAAGSTAGATSATGATAGATGAGATGAGAAGAGASAAGAGASALGSAGSALSAGAGALAGKAAAGLAAAAIVTTGAVVVSHTPQRRAGSSAPTAHSGSHTVGAGVASVDKSRPAADAKSKKNAKHHAKLAATKTVARTPVKPNATNAGAKAAADKTATPTKATPQTPPGRGQTQSDPTVLTSQSGGSGSTGSASGSPDSSSGSGSTPPSGSSTSSGTTGPSGPTGASGSDGSGDPSTTGPTNPLGSAGAGSGTTGATGPVDGTAPDGTAPTDGTTPADGTAPADGSAGAALVISG
jgi:RNA polymerase sigma factor (sigma-70 family)